MSKQMKRVYPIVGRASVGILMAFGLFALLPAVADATIIIDPDGVGATGVFPNLETNPLRPTSQISVGFSRPGTVEVNAESSGNGHTEVTGEGLLIGWPDAPGEVRIIGNGTSGSAKITINDGIGARVGFGGNGTLEIRQGGMLQSNEQIHLGEESLSGESGTSTVIVDGAGSVLRSEVSGSGTFRSGGRIYVPFTGVDTNLTVSNGGLVEAIGGNLEDFEDGSIYIGVYTEDKPGNVNVNITGEGSTLRAQHGVYVLDDLGQTVVNVTDGGQIEQAKAGYVLDGEIEPGLAIGSTGSEGARVNVSGLSTSGAASSISTVTGIDIGFERTIAGFTADGEPRLLFADGAAGEQITDRSGNPLFDWDGNPVLGELVDFGGGFTAVLPGADVAVKTVGHLLVENGAMVTSQGDINISENADDPQAVPLNGRESTLTVRSSSVVEAPNVIVNEDGLLTGDGTIVGDVVVDGGTVAPGNSPGTLTIDGNFIVDAGTLELEINSLLERDLFDVSGAVVIGEFAMINLILGFDPIEVLDIEDFFTGYTAFLTPGGFNPLTNIEVLFLNGSGLTNGDLVQVGFSGQSFALAARGIGGVAAVPEPGILALMVFGLGGLAFMRRKTTRRDWKLSPRVS